MSRRVMSEIPASHVDILEARCFGHVAALADDADRSCIDRFAKKYMGQDHYPFDPPGEERVVVTVHVEQVSVAHVHAGTGDGRPPAEWTR